FEAGFADARWAAGVAMAPGDFHRFGDGVAAVGAPVLVAGGGLDPGGDGSDYWEVLSAGAEPAGDRWLRIDAAGHQSFTDFSGLLERFDGLIPAADGFGIVDAYVLGAVQAAGGDASVVPLLSAFPGPISGVSLSGAAP
ncbi:MAG: hypothetical protein H0V89_12225, partial [Deltaproteobacteria bacterium]|nr:hypothetical protein [Deltaproteobacteria bacterium]